MDKLKDFIQDNIEAFDDDFLPEGHFERFEKKLPREQKRRFSLFSLSALAAAASLALLFLIGTPQSEDDEFLEALAREKEEMDGLQMYYRMQMDEIILQMEDLSKNQAKGTADLLEESRQIMEDSRTFEETVLPTLPCTGEGVLAMSRHYNASVDGLSTVLSHMKQATSENNNR